MKKKIAIVGGGSSALFLACELNPQKFDVSIYESNKALGRKFLVAGDGGLNITHSENEADFLKKYTPHEFISEAFNSFTNKDLVKWLEKIEVDTFVGSSGRVFPVKNLKPVEVLNLFLSKINENKVSIKTEHLWSGFIKSNSLLFEYKKKDVEAENDVVIFCLGGASWPVTGSKGDWINYFSEKNILVNPFLASNCEFIISWPPNFGEKIEGKVLKNISISCNNKLQLGEAVLTKVGIEGNAIYPLSSEIRKQLLANQSAEIYIDLKPGVSVEKIESKIREIIHKKEFSKNLKTALNLQSIHLQLLKSLLSKEDFLNEKKLSHFIKNIKLNIIATGEITKAISTVGGISLKEIDNHFQLKKLPNHYVIGEMLDYDAPTGGYLLQSCFSMAKYLANHLNTTH